MVSLSEFLLQVQFSLLDLPGFILAKVLKIPSTSIQSRDIRKIAASHNELCLIDRSGCARSGLTEGRKKKRKKARKRERELWPFLPMTMTMTIMSLTLVSETGCGCECGGFFLSFIVFMNTLFADEKMVGTRTLPATSQRFHFHVSTLSTLIFSRISVNWRNEDNDQRKFVLLEGPSCHGQTMEDPLH